MIATAYLVFSHRFVPRLYPQSHKFTQPESRAEHTDFTRLQQIANDCGKTLTTTTTTRQQRLINQPRGWTPPSMWKIQRQRRDADAENETPAKTTRSQRRRRQKDATNAKRRQKQQRDADNENKKDNGEMPTATTWQ